MTPSFTLAHWCILFAALLPIVCAGIAKSGQLGKPRREGGYDNHDPRAWMARQSDWRARANNAQINSFEALPFFFVAVLSAQYLQAPVLSLDLLAVAFVGLRVAYIYCYIADKAAVRSVVWSLAFAVNVAILLIGFR
ncbi:MAG: MAPEG family protein [Comamonadaceae bacterium]|nr:MAPEG family protein [Comamonadaceae bacterium]